MTKIPDLDLDAQGDDLGLDVDLTDGAPDEPVIEPLSFTDGYSGAVATFTYGSGDGQLELVKDDGENYQRIRVILTEEDLIAIAERFGNPLAAYQEIYQDWQAREHTVRDETRRREHESRPFVWVDYKAPGRQWLPIHSCGTVHRSTCRIVKGHGRQHYGQVADIVTKALDHLVEDLEPTGMAQRQASNARVSRGHVRHTLKLCGICKPIGDQSGPISHYLDVIANTVTTDPTGLALSASRVRTFLDLILLGLTETAQEHAVRIAE